MDITRIAPRRVYGEEDQRLFKNLRDAMHSIPFEENQLSRTDFDRRLIAAEE